MAFFLAYDDFDAAVFLRRTACADTAAQYSIEKV
jgi:hypothetical protein